jgi:homoserine O-acetyltransferase
MAAALASGSDIESGSPLPESGVLQLPQFTLACGKVLQAELAWQSWGTNTSPVVVVLGGISAGRNLGSWWNEQCGVDRVLDPRQFRLISIDWLGGADASTGPAHGEAFPAIDSRDQANAILTLLNHLGIARICAVVGASYGACVAQHLAVLLGSRLDQLIVIGAAHRASPWALALRTLQRAGIVAATDSAAREDALHRARQIAVLGYRTPEELERRFGELTPDVGVLGWLDAHGARFVRRFPAESFLCLSASLDAHRCDPATIKVPTTVVGIAEDLLVPLALIEEFSRRLGGSSRFVVIESEFGHDAFLKEQGAIAKALQQAILTESAV